MKHVALGDIVLTEEMLQQIVAIGNDPKRIAKEVMEPALPEINRRVGQENDPLYLAYMVAHVLQRVGAFKQVTREEG